MNARAILTSAVAAISITASAGLLDDIASAVDKAKEQYEAAKAQGAAQSVSDAELLRMVRDQYARDMECGNYSRWHGKLSQQIVIDEPGSTNLASMVKVFADGFAVTNRFRREKPRSDAERKIIAAKRAEESLRAQIAMVKKQIDEMKAGVPLAALEAKAAALEAKLNPVAETNVVRVIGSSASGK